MPVTGTWVVPYRDRVTDSSGLLSDTFQSFMRVLYDRVNPIGEEKSFTLVNNVAVAASIEGMKFDPRKISVAHIDFLIQRVTTGGGATQLIAAGTFIIAYRPNPVGWSYYSLGAGPDASGITFTITSAGQVQYTSTNITGTASISKLYWRARTMSGKNVLYSQQGG